MKSVFKRLIIFTAREEGKMEDDIKRIDTNDLRVNLTKYLTKNLGDTIYITRYNRLVGEIRVYTEEIRRKTELRIAKKMIEVSEREKKRNK
jgi:hypothetical protein